jgi:hypothetical protein
MKSESIQIEQFIDGLADRMISFKIDINESSQSTTVHPLVFLKRDRDKRILKADVLPLNKTRSAPDAWDGSPVIGSVTLLFSKFSAQRP